MFLPWLEPARSAKRCDREEHENTDDTCRQRDDPIRHVASPGAQDGIEPGDGQNRENRADNFMKELFQSAPKSAEAALRRGVDRTDGSGHDGQSNADGCGREGIQQEHGCEPFGDMGLTVACNVRNVSLK